MDRTIGTFFNGATSCNATNSNCVTYSYDAEGNLKTRTDSAGGSAFTYDLMNRQTVQEVPGSIVRLEYDGNGNLTSHTLDEATDQVTTYTYSDANQLTGVTNDGLNIGGNKIDISPDQDGRVKQIRFPTTNNLRANFDFKKSGKPRKADVVKGSSEAQPSTLQTLRKYDYDYLRDVLGFEVEVGQLQGKTVEIDGSSKTTSYTYAKDRLVSSTIDGQPDYFYTHDDVGNVTSEDSTGTTTYFGYDRAGQLCWRGQSSGTDTQKLATDCLAGPSGSTTFGQDAAGNNTNTTSAPTVYNDDSQVATIAGINMGYLDRGNDLRVTSGPTTYVNSPLGVAAKKTGTAATYYVRDPRGTILASYGAGGTLFEPPRDGWRVHLLEG